MSNPLLELRKILNPSSIAETGTVVSSGECVLVSTKTGVKTVSNNLPVAVGDCVLIQNGAIQRKVRNQDQLPVYHM